MRSKVLQGDKPTDLTSKSAFDDEQYLRPILKDDALLYSLDSVMGSFVQEGPLTNGMDKDLLPDGNVAAKRVVELQEELQLLQQQFAEYRQAVDKTLEDRWNSKEGISEDSNGPEKLSSKSAAPRDDDSHYFSSYSSNGQSFQRYVEESRC